MKKCFHWINSRPMRVKDNINKGDKIDMRLYLLQEIKIYQFIELNEERFNENILQRNILFSTNEKLSNR